MCKRWAMVMVLALIWPCSPAIAQSLTGTTGLVSVPTAEILEDGNVVFGANFIERRFLGDGLGNFHGTAYFVSLGYLPFLEVSARFTMRVNKPRQGMGDRMVSVRLKLVEERGRRPSVAVGIQDVKGTRKHHALYLVASRQVHVPVYHWPVGVHLGYASKRLEAIHHQFSGFFGGVSCSPLPFLTMLLEYDSNRVSSGLRVLLLDRIAILAAWQGFRAFSGGVSYAVTL